MRLSVLKVGCHVCPSYHFTAKVPRNGVQSGYFETTYFIPLTLQDGSSTLRDVFFQPKWWLDGDNMVGVGAE